jgi:sulfate permease, SulP family
MNVSRFVRIFSWLPRYDRSWLTFDAIAGLTLWGLVVPEGMAYAGIAGLPPQAGLYTLTVSLLVYALLGTSRHLSVGGTSATAALLASSVAAALVASAVATASDPQTYWTYASAFVLVTGLVFLAAGVARLGFITQFLSKPVMDGFVVGLAVFVAVGQLSKLVGVEKPEGNTVEKLVGIIRELPQANPATVAAGVFALAALFLLPRLSRRLPAGLIVLFAAIALSSVLDLAGQGVEVVGSLPQGLPTPAMPVIPLDDYLGMVLPAVGVLLVAFSESLGVAHEFAEKHGYEVDSDQELNAHAVVNLGSGLFGGMLAAGGMSGSAVKEGAGARTQVANLVAWAATIVTLLFLTPVFSSLPEAVLAALIIHAVWHILAARKLMTLRKQAPVEVWFGVLAFAGVLLARLRHLPVEPPAPLIAGAGPRCGRGLLRPDAPPGERACAGGPDRPARRTAVLRQRTDGARPGQGCDARRGAAAQGSHLRRRGPGRSRLHERAGAGAAGRGPPRQRTRCRLRQCARSRDRGRERDRSARGGQPLPGVPDGGPGRSRVRGAREPSSGSGGRHRVVGQP